MRRRAKDWWGRCLYKMISWEPCFFSVLRSERCCSLHHKARNECVEYNVGSFSKDRTNFAAVTKKPQQSQCLNPTKIYFLLRLKSGAVLFHLIEVLSGTQGLQGRRARRWKCLAFSYLGPAGTNGSPVHFIGHVASTQLQESLINIGAHGYLLSSTNS